MENKVDFHAVSLVKDAQVVHELKNYLQSNISINMFTQKRKFELHNNPAYLTQTKEIPHLAGCGADIHVIVRIESADSNTKFTFNNHSI